MMCIKFCIKTKTERPNNKILVYGKNRPLLFKIRTLMIFLKILNQSKSHKKNNNKFCLNKKKKKKFR